MTPLPPAARLRAALLCGALVAAITGCGTEELLPGGPSIAGAWTARLPLGGSADSLLLVLDDSGSVVRGVGYVSPARGTLLGGEGSVVEDHLMLTLRGGSPADSVELSLQRTDERFEGTAVVDGMAYAATLRRTPLGTEAAGTWVLAAIRAPGAAGALPFDTLRLDAVGSGHRGYADTSCGFSVPAAVIVAGGWVRVEYLSAAGYGGPCAPPTRDSLQFVGDTLVRRTALAGSDTREERYLRH